MGRDAHSDSSPHFPPNRRGRRPWLSLAAPRNAGELLWGEALGNSSTQGKRGVPAYSTQNKSCQMHEDNFLLAFRPRMWYIGVMSKPHRPSVSMVGGAKSRAMVEEQAWISISGSTIGIATVAILARNVQDTIELFSKIESNIEGGSEVRPDHRLAGEGMRWQR